MRNEKKRNGSLAILSSRNRLHSAALPLGSQMYYYKTCFNKNSEVKAELGIKLGFYTSQSSQSDPDPACVLQLFSMPDVFANIPCLALHVFFSEASGQESEKIDSSVLVSYHLSNNRDSLAFIFLKRCSVYQWSSVKRCLKPVDYCM